MTSGTHARWVDVREPDPAEVVLMLLIPEHTVAAVHSVMNAKNAIKSCDVVNRALRFWPRSTSCWGSSTLCGFGLTGTTSQSRCRDKNKLLVVSHRQTVPESDSAAEPGNTAVLQEIFHLSVSIVTGEAAVYKDLKPSESQKMFAAEAKAIVRNVGAQENLIPNHDLNKKLDLLTLVRVRDGRFWQLPKYRTLLCKLPELMEEELCPDFEEEVLVKDFVTSVETSGSGTVGGGEQLVGGAKITANTDSVDGLVLPVSIKKKTAVIRSLRSRPLNKGKVADLGLKDNDRLTFVHQTLYNTGPVKMVRKAKRDGSISASCQKMLSLFVKGRRQEETSFTVPEESMFAYGLVEINFKDEQLNISYEPWTHKQSLLSCDSTDSEALQRAREGIQMKEGLLRPLAELPESTRRHLLNKLREVLQNREALTLLEETLDQRRTGACDPPPSPPSWIFWMFPTSPQLRRTPFTCWSAPWTLCRTERRHF
ncbi:uncharacterized protein [Leuresthes tenuis]|uniref:uncharacterized protein n=1 Tax=Leuresthes tenuis TaxID=355514 RepID=UPI003B502136